MYQFFSFFPKSTFRIFCLANVYSEIEIWIQDYWWIRTTSWEVWTKRNIASLIRFLFIGKRHRICISFLIFFRIILSVFCKSKVLSEIETWMQDYWWIGLTYRVVRTKRNIAIKVIFRYSVKSASFLMSDKVSVYR